VPRKFPRVLSTTLLNTVEDDVTPTTFVPLSPNMTLSLAPGTPAVPVPPVQLPPSDQLVVVVLPALQNAVPACARGENVSSPIKTANKTVLERGFKFFIGFRFLLIFPPNYRCNCDGNYIQLPNIQLGGVILPEFADLHSCTNVWFLSGDLSV